MAGIIISEASAQNNALFGEVQYPIASFLESRFEAAEQESIASKITRKVNSTHAREGYAGMGSMDDFLPTVENGDYPHTDMKVAYTKDIKNITWKNSFSVSKEMLDDSNFKEIFKRAAGLVKRYHSTRENFFMELLGTAGQGVLYAKRHQDRCHRIRPAAHVLHRPQGRDRQDQAGQRLL